MLNKFLKEWYTLSKSQRRGTVVLFILFLAAIMFKMFYSFETDNQAVYFANIHIQNTDDKAINKFDKSNFHKDSLFFFDPNTVTEYEMQVLGFSEKLIKNIINYRQAGGKFYNAESLKKLYTMNDSVYNIIVPYVLINKDFTDKSAGRGLVKDEQKDTSATKKFLSQNFQQKIIGIELNSADSIQLDKLKGVGKVLSARIIKYRNRLGGYYSVEQLKEVYGITDSSYKYIITKNKITVDTQLIRKINISTADFKTLIRHPYFNYNKDVIIKILKSQKQGLSKEKLLGIVGEEQWKKLRYYIEF